MKSAIHVKSDIAWQECSYTLRYSQTDSLKSMVPIYQSLINGGNNLNILVYSGDDDSVCGTVGTQNWIWDMGYSAGPTNTWSEYSLDSQTVGYITKWTKQKLAFVTVNYRVYNNIPNMLLSHPMLVSLAGSWCWTRGPCLQAGGRTRSLHQVPAGILDKLSGAAATACWLLCILGSTRQLVRR